MLYGDLEFMSLIMSLDLNQMIIPDIPIHLASMGFINGLVQTCSISSASAMEML